MWRQFRRSHPPRDGEASSDPRVSHFRWTSQEPTKVATVSQIAAPQGRRGLLRSPCVPLPLDLPRAHESGDSFADRSPPGSQPPRDDEASSDPRVSHFR